MKFVITLSCGITILSILPSIMDLFNLANHLTLKVQELCIFEHLRVMIIEDMIYLIHVRELAAHVQSSLNSNSQLLFVDLEHDPPKVFLWTTISMISAMDVLTFPIC